MTKRIEKGRGGPFDALRVLVVDDEADVRRDHEKNLRLWGYVPIVAEGEQDKLIADARQQVRRRRCHLALVDMRLQDNTDTTDWSGIELLDSLRPAASVVVTGYGSIATALRSVHSGAADYVEKQDGPRRLREALDRAAESVVRNPDLRLVWPPDLRPRDIIERFADDDPSRAEEWKCAPDDEVELVIRQMYDPVVATVEFAPVEAETADRSVANLRSVVLYARPSDRVLQPHKPEIVKLAPVERIRAEVRNYQDWVLNFLDNKRSARIEHDPALRWDVGGIRYTNEAGDKGKTFVEFYSEKDSAQIAKALDDLAGVTLAPWREAGRGVSWGSVYEAYARVLPTLDSRLVRLPSGDSLEIAGLSGPLVNPVTWTLAHRDQARFESRWEAITHGDLRAANVFVDPQGRTSVIDYERTGPGFAWRDAAELEKDIKVRLMHLDRDQMPLAVHVERLLLASLDPTVTPKWKDLPGADPAELAEAKKAFEAAVSLRRAFFRNNRPDTLREYYWALLLESLVTATISFERRMSPRDAALARDRALVSAALACERLEWGDRPATEWLRR